MPPASSARFPPSPRQVASIRFARASTAEELRAAIADADAVVSGGGVFDAAAFDAMKRGKLVVSCSVGLDRVDVAYTVTPIIPGAAFNVVLPANLKFHRQVSMRSLF